MPRGKPLSFDRQEVLAKAMELFWANGYEATGMTELLEQMGIQRQSFYNTFGNKQEVFVEALELYTSQLSRRIINMLRESDNPIANLEAVLDFWMAEGEMHPGLGCLLGNTVAECGYSDDRIAELCRTKLTTMEDVFTEVFQDAISKGYLPRDRDARASARTIITIGQGLALLSKAGMGVPAQRDVIETMRRSLLN
jgi:TetR/AcrR family transcriptional repressor of nem operon